MDEIKPPQRVASLASQLVASLRELIESGEWPVGMRIPPEQVLVEQLGVGRSTLREALGALSHLGLLEARVGDGTYVRASSELQSVMVRRASTGRRDEVLELCAVLEEYASGIAALRRSEDDVRRLRELSEVMAKASTPDDMAALAGADGTFHRTVVQASGNSLLIEVYDYLGTALASALGGLPWSDSAAAEHAEQHRLLVDAIEARDEDEARRAAAAIVGLTRNHPPDR